MRAAGADWPAAPTLCDGWTTLDLAAHLVLRERRPDAGAGIMIGPLAGYTRRVQQGLTKRESFEGLIGAIRNGPPRVSLFGLPGVDERANLVEFFVHHEDIRRGTPGWAERKVTPALSEALWRRLGMARFVLRKAPVGVELVRDDITTDPGQGRVRITAKARTPVVTVTGAPGELTLWTVGPPGRRAGAPGRHRGGGPHADRRPLGALSHSPAAPSPVAVEVTPRRRPGHGVITARREWRPHPNCSPGGPPPFTGKAALRHEPATSWSIPPATIPPSVPSGRGCGPPRSQLGGGLSAQE